MAVPLWLSRMLGCIAIVMGLLIAAVGFGFDADVSTLGLGRVLTIAGTLVAGGGAVLLKGA